MTHIVETASGKMSGMQIKTCLAFRGIPFAKPPVGKLRFLPPEPLAPWAGIREATAYGKACPQRVSGVEFMDAGVPLDEDCLYLNVYTPSTEGARPVMVWIHGGGFSLGSGSQKGYNTGHIVQKGDIVLVTINYRVGPLGYIYLGGHGGDAWGASANVGQLDQIAALKWVKENIAAFGGDPNNVTIFGESAGSAAVAALLAMPEARGLFHRAIGESGTANFASRPEFAYQVTDKFLKQLNLPAGESHKLQEKSWEDLIQASQDMMGGEELGFGNPMLSFWPLVDGKTIPVPPLRAVREGSAKGVPIIFGSNRDEMVFALAISGRKADKMDDAGLKQRVEMILRANQDKADQMIDVYRKSRKERGLPHENHNLFYAIITDMQMRIPSIRLLEAQQRHESRVYNYLFCWELEALKASIHGLEIPFVFGTVGPEFSQDRVMAASGEGVEKLSDNMMKAWTAFARTGDPSIPGWAWAPYDEKRRATMIYDTESKVADAPFDEELAAWDDVMKRK
jgi:para-nitrobenzyl esterase